MENWPLSPSYNRRYFFDSGIRFECRQCGSCCTGSPGIVRVTAQEMGIISGFLGIDENAFSDRFLSWVNGRASIREDRDGRCLMYRKGCTIYRVRPLQCRSFPFWFRNLRSERAWREIERSCPGTGQGRLYSRDDILRQIGDAGE